MVVIQPSIQSERRTQARLITPACPRCPHHPPMIGFVRTPDAVYFRCRECQELLVKLIPPIPLSTNLVA